ncbi:hypothetical protein AAFF_G00199880 [Aldrovandia affinis]|uniref:IF rod domain-containing protein n=1 Tax=Aldrovandia affinis TaxID=143900 RepID=A0AAD7W558_9TELE|nr:hypothetical protein AAFF_G00199880 [Aldrovandia affinis]
MMHRQQQHMSSRSHSGVMSGSRGVSMSSRSTGGTAGGYGGYGGSASGRAGGFRTSGYGVSGYGSGGGMGGGYMGGSSAMAGFGMSYGGGGASGGGGGGGFSSAIRSSYVGAVGSGFGMGGGGGGGGGSGGGAMSGYARGGGGYGGGPFGGGGGGGGPGYGGGGPGYGGGGPGYGGPGGPGGPGGLFGFGGPGGPSGPGGDGGYDLLSGNEKQVLQTLNDRLATYLEKVRSLETNNRELEEKLRAFTINKVQTRDLRVYEEQLAPLREQLLNFMLDNARMALELDNAKLTADDFRMKFESEYNMRQSVEGDIAGLKALRTEYDFSNTALGQEYQLLQDERRTMIQAHEEEMVVLRGEMAGTVTVDIQAAESVNLSRILEEVRTEYEAVVQRNRQEAESWYLKQMETRTVEDKQTTEQTVTTSTEILDGRKQCHTLQTEIDSMQVSKRTLEENLIETETQFQMQLQRLNGMVMTIESELSTVTGGGHAAGPGLPGPPQPESEAGEGDRHLQAAAGRGGHGGHHGWGRHGWGRYVVIQLLFGGARIIGRARIIGVFGRGSRDGTSVWKHSGQQLNDDAVFIEQLRNELIQR